MRRALAVLLAAGALVLGCLDSDLPEGDSTVAGAERSCAMRDLDTCLAQKGCLIMTADRVDARRMCLSRLAEAACGSPTRVCETTPTKAVAPDGTCWQFRNDCIPLNWKRAEESAGQCAELDAVKACPDSAP